MPGPNDFHYNKQGQLLPGLGADERERGGTAVAEPPRLDGRTTLAKKERAVSRAAEQLAKERQQFETERAAFLKEREGK